MLVICLFTEKIQVLIRQVLVLVGEFCQYFIEEMLILKNLNESEAILFAS